MVTAYASFRKDFPIRHLFLTGFFLTGDRWTYIFIVDLHKQRQFGSGKNNSMVFSAFYGVMGSAVAGTNYYGEGFLLNIGAGINDSRNCAYYDHHRRCHRYSNRYPRSFADGTKYILTKPK